jgi:hypothetical protein
MHKFIHFNAQFQDLPKGLKKVARNRFYLTFKG